MTEREFSLEVIRRLREAGYEAYWAGGCVRDQLLGFEPDDYDVATNAPPEAVQKLFRRTVAVGASFGVVEVLGPNGISVQVATFRSEEGYSDGRHPDRVRFSSAREDALRRDFTINGIFYDPLTGQYLDYVGGRKDLEARILRAIGDPRQRFAEDKLRLLRAARMAARFELTIDPATEAAIREMADQILVVSAERIAEELRKMFADRHRGLGVRLLDSLQLLRPLFPEVADLARHPSHPSDRVAKDLLSHTFFVVDHLSERATFEVTLAALLHECNKTTGQPLAAVATSVADRLRLSNAEKKRIVWLTRHHADLRNAREMRLAELKRLLSHEAARELLDLHRADALAMGQSDDHVRFCEEHLSHWTPQDLNPEPLLTGHDLAKLGVPRGPLYGKILKAVRDAQLDERIRTRDEALALARRLAAG